MSEKEQRNRNANLRNAVCSNAINWNGDPPLRKGKWDAVVEKLACVQCLSQFNAAWLWLWRTLSMPRLLFRSRLKAQSDCITRVMTVCVPLSLDCEMMGLVAI